MEKETIKDQWCIIVDPLKRKYKDDALLFTIDGPFDSREQAEEVLKSNPEKYSDGTQVICFSTIR